MTTEQVLGRARKLLALATSPNEHEAALAAERLQALLLAHQLEAADLAEAGGPPLEPIGEGTAEQGARLVAWQTYLLAGVAESHLCKHLIYRGYHRTARVRHALIGRPANTALATQTYVYLKGTVERLAAQALREAQAGGGWVDSPRAWGNSFRTGCALRLSERLRERLRAEAAAKDAGTHLRTSMALVIRDEQTALSSYMAEHHAKLSAGPRLSSGSDHDGYRAGRRAGDAVNLDRQISGGGSRQPALRSGRELF